MTRPDLPEWIPLCDDIDDGEYDDGLDQIIRAASARLDVVARRNARRLIQELAKGDRVVVLDTVTPRYYAGMVGTVSELREAGVVILLDDLPSTRGRTPDGGRSRKVVLAYTNIQRLDEDDPRFVASPTKRINPEEIGDDADYEGEDDEYEDEEED